MKKKKSEKTIENTFSIEFSRMQSNTCQYFSKYFQAHRQTFENKFFFSKILNIFHLKIF